MTPSPKRMADYFFMVGLHDDFSLIDNALVDQQGLSPPECSDTTHTGHHHTPTSPTVTTTSKTTTGAQADWSPTHSSISHGDTTYSDPTTSPTSILSSPPQAYAPPVKSHTRSRSKSMAQFSHTDQPLSEHFHKQEGPKMPQRTLSPEDDPALKDISEAMSRSSGTVTSIKRPARRSVTMSDISQQGSIGLHHRASYRHVSAGSLYKSVQEGRQQGLTREKILEGREEDRQVAPDAKIQGQSDTLQAGSAVPRRHGAYLTSQQYRQNATLSVYDVQSLAHGKSMAVIRSLSKLDHGVQKAHIGSSSRSVKASPDTHPGERVFSPVVTCRYPEKDWNDSEVFPSHLPMSESEMEYIKAIKTKILREKSLLQSLNERLREERTLGRRSRIVDIKHDIADSEEKLALLQDQMEPWKRIFVEAEDAWIPRCIGLVSAIPYHYLLRDWLLAVVVACSGGVNHPGMRVYIPILPAALMTCLQAPVPYIIGVERSCCDEEFPPEEACVVDLDKGTLDVQLAPMQLPTRPRRKLVQSLEMYAPISAVQRTPTSHSTAFGPPDYVKMAYPHSRLTLFCGASRAPRMGRRSESLRPPAPSSVSTMTASSIQGSLAGASRNSSTHTLGQPIGQNPPALPKLPKMDFEKETLFEGGLMGLEFEDALKDKEEASLQPDSMLAETHGRPSMPDSKGLPSNKVAPEQDATEVISTATRRVITPQRSRANVFEMPRKQEADQRGPQQDTGKNSMDSNQFNGAAFWSTQKWITHVYVDIYDYGKHQWVKQRALYYAFIVDLVAPSARSWSL
ncbi:hypothetical protein BGZ95_001896 [Linnemannia exigua]|uniref:cDENN domain-containing protein n=1 Tax=Linnemannia exigua TaxID=604196 RepID=A0AAD4D806_9FUNG|nr:hypothetical protein BGZ95_001896 [Linnemannia exigua]